MLSSPSRGWCGNSAQRSSPQQERGAGVCSRHRWTRLPPDAVTALEALLNRPTPDLPTIPQTSQGSQDNAATIDL